MSLEPGTRIANYEIIDLVGAGGMGEVYRARDTKLGRDVAIKVLPEELSKDRERRERFEREAKLLASLNHPAIATLHGFEDGFLVMELVEGETLAERIGRGAIPVDEALPLFIQIAEGIEAAHEKGVIHRDLKPANIKITPEGQVKILDFGLAKAFAPEENVSAEMSQSPTLTKGTALGAIMGTASYMSPEQARGKHVDRRTDVWAFGCCLFEALTGRKAFDGETVTDILATVVKNEPEWKLLPSALPPKASELLGLCLRKHPKARLQHIGDARVFLDDASKEPPGEKVATTPRSWVPMALAALALVAAVASWLVRGPRAEQRAVRLAVPLPEDVMFPETRGLEAASLALSPDGSRLVYAGVRDGIDQLFLRELSATESVPLRGTEGGSQPFFSPDGRWIGFAADGRLKKVSISGNSPPVTICSFEYILLGANWPTEEEILFAIMGQGLMKVSAGGGEPVSVAAIDAGAGEVRRSYPDALPGERGALVNIARGGDEEGNISLLVQGSPPRTLIQQGLIAKFSPNGHILFTREGTLFAAAVDPGTLETTGTPVPIAEGVQRYRDFALSREGTLAYIAGPMDNRSELRLVRVDRDGTPEEVAGAPRRSARSNAPRLSPDGIRIALGVSAVVEGPDVFVLDLDRGSSRRLTFSEGPSGGVGPVWSPDGERVYFASDRIDGVWRTFVTSADGSTEARLVTDWNAYHRPTSISPDGKTLVLRVQSERGDWDIDLLRLGDEGLGKPEPLLATPYEETSGMVSPDGRFLAYVSDESGREEIYVQPFPDLGSKKKVSVDGGNEPLWSRDGRELFYRAETQMMAVDVVTEPDFEPGKPRALFDDPYYRSDRGRPAYYDVSPDGNFFYLFQPIAPESKPHEIQIVLNWPALLEPDGR